MIVPSPYHLFGDVRSGNYTEIDPLTGLVRLHGSARPYIGVIVPLTAMEQTAAPGYDATNFGYLFPNNSTAEFLTANFCLDHDYAEGTSLYPRVIWHQASADVPTWKIAYRWINPGGQVTATFTTVASTAEEFTYIQGTIQQISTFAAISGSGKKIGSILQIKLYREDNDLAGDALAVAFALYKQVDGLGSQTTILKAATDTIATASPSASISNSPSTSISGSPSSSPSSSISGSPSSSVSGSISGSPSSSISGSPSSSVSSSPSSSVSASPSVSVSSSVSSSVSGSGGSSISSSISSSPSSSVSGSISSSPSASVSGSPSSSVSGSISSSPSASGGSSASASPSNSPSPSPS